MEYGFSIAAYVVAAVLFILSLGGLSGQESAKRAVWYGIAGMALAVIATLIGPGSGLWLLSLVLVAGGGLIGWYVAKRVQMTEMPQLVAAMHSLVGLAAVFVGYNAYIEAARVAAVGRKGRVGQLMQALVGGGAGVLVVDPGLELARIGLGLFTEQALAFYVRAHADRAQRFDQAHGHMAFANGGDAMSDRQEIRGNCAVAFRQIGVVAILAQRGGALHVIGIG